MATFTKHLETAMLKASQNGTRKDDETAVALASAALKSKDTLSKDLAVAALLGILLEEISLRDVLHTFLQRYAEELGMCEDIESNETVLHLRDYFTAGFQFLSADAAIQRIHVDLVLSKVVEPYYPQEMPDGK